MAKRPHASDASQQPADRRTSGAADRLCAGLFLLYQRATRAQESDPFPLNAQTWSAFEQSALPEISSFSFFDRSQDTTITPNAVLANAMRHVWIALGSENLNTIQAIRQVAKYLFLHYEITAVDRRARTRASIGLDFLG